MRALQADDFANPGMLWVEEGERISESSTCGFCDDFEGFFFGSDPLRLYDKVESIDDILEGDFFEIKTKCA